MISVQCEDYLEAKAGLGSPAPCSTISKGLLQDKTFWISTPLLYAWKDSLARTCAR